LFLIDLGRNCTRILDDVLVASLVAQSDYTKFLDFSVSSFVDTVFNDDDVVVAAAVAVVVVVVDFVVLLFLFCCCC
jgi:hypothetical protein